MKVFLDDMRPAPSGWIRTRSVQETIEFLRSHKVTNLSLDHDLGTEKTGYDVILWIEQQVVYHNFTPPKIVIHSANPVGRDRMMQGISSIYRLGQKCKEGD